MAMIMMAFSAKAQTEGTEGEEPKTVDVVAYFCKNDSMEYRSVVQEWKVVDGDTTSISIDVTDFTICVIDSTSEGYRMEVTFGDSYVENENLMKQKLAEISSNLTKGMKCILVTDELGVIQHVENWREIRDAMNKAVTLVLDTIYAQASMLDSLMPRRQFESLMRVQFSTEQGVLSSFEELALLFSLHGNSFNYGETSDEGTNDAGYPQVTKIDAFETAMQNEDTDCEGDYAILSTSLVTIQSEDVLQTIQNALGIILSDQVSDVVQSSAKEEFSQKAEKAVLVTVKEQYAYSYNGWPKSMRKDQEFSFMGQEKHTTKLINWLSRHWQ